MSTIKAVANKLNLSVSTIRYYEKNGLLDIHRKENNYREYSLDDEKKLKLILVMKYSGFTIKEIKKLLSLNNEKVLEDDCIRETNQIISMKKNEILMKIENYKNVIELLDMMKPLAVAKATTENELALEKQIDLIFKKTIKED
ncbi:MerR family transcriptional regulator [Paenibacillus sanguinis]|uniref:MerR family transcriptional regulator n=1 Tax=Paenibacillus sanguinis TaxID=225906 RepID=UPI000363CDA6|nr:MerR family transcriptional regulator [Paenibacillus sanguinis]